MKNNVRYAVHLRWIRPVKQTVQKDTKLAQFIPLATSDEMEEKSNGIPSVETRVFLPEFTQLASFLGFKQKDNNGTFHSEDREAYLRLLVYAVGRQSIRSEIKAKKLAGIVKNLHYTELKYWASIYSEYFKEYNSRGKLYRPARAFREVYKLDW